MGKQEEDMSAANKFSGLWYCRYWYPSNDHPGEDISEYCARIEPSGRQFVLHSLSDMGETKGAYMLARFSVDDTVVTGSWLENTSPQGSFKGAMYSGVFQLLLDETATRIVGKWTGIGQEQGKMQVYTGRWEIARMPEEDVAKRMRKQHKPVIHAQ